MVLEATSIEFLIYSWMVRMLAMWCSFFLIGVPFIQDNGKKFVLYFLYLVDVSFGCCPPDLYVMIVLTYILYRLSLMAIFNVLFLESKG